MKAQGPPNQPARVRRQRQLPSKDADASLALALRIKLEYERECYRQAETRARGRLNELQTSVAATVKAVEAQKRQQ